MSMRQCLTAFSSARGYKGWSRTRLYGSRRLSTRESLYARACGPLRMPAAIGAARAKCWRNVWYARDTVDRAAYLVGLHGRRDLGGLERLVLQSFWLIEAGLHRRRVHAMTVRLGCRTARVRYNSWTGCQHHHDRRWASGRASLEQERSAGRPWRCHACGSRSSPLLSRRRHRVSWPTEETPHGNLVRRGPPYCPRDAGHGPRHALLPSGV
jgi:hypothetical protein